MGVFNHPEFDHHDSIHYFDDPASGLRAIIAIHSTALGPAAGGCRRWAYASDDAAFTDVLRLSRGMTYKNAVAGLPFGGGKAVILAADKAPKSRALFEAFGRAVDSLQGRYITAEDVGISVEIVRSTAPAMPCWIKALTRTRPMPCGAIAKLHSLVASNSLICLSFMMERTIIAAWSLLSGVSVAL